MIRTDRYKLLFARLQKTHREVDVPVDVTESFRKLIS